MRRSLLSVTRLAAIALALALTTPALAQEQHTVRIEGGAVFVDGRRVPPNELPPSLRVDDVRLRLEGSGHWRFHVDGRQYGLRDGRVVEIPVDADDFVVYFADEAENVHRVGTADGAGYRFRVDSPENATIGTYLKVLDEQAARFEQLSAQLAPQRTENPVVVANRLREEAEEAAVMVRAFPRVEVQTYLRGLQDRDRTLYDRLVREQRMEVASSELARQVFAARDDPSRRTLTEDLRRQLEEIFELKQQNRRDEIEQLEMQLAELREQLAARERNREAIIGKRLNTLIGHYDR